jgi:hypothetical protein
MAHFWTALKPALGLRSRSMNRLAVLGLVWTLSNFAPGTVHAEAPAAHAATALDTDARAAQAPPADADDDAAARESAPTTAASVNETRTRSLQLQLAAVERERADTSLLWPWVLTASGVAMLVLGVAIEVSETRDCGRTCDGAAWPAWLAVGGTTLGAAGVVWVSLASRDLFELDARRHDLQYQLQNQRWDQAHSQASPQLALSLHGMF